MQGLYKYKLDGYEKEPNKAPWMHFHKALFQMENQAQLD